MNVSLSTVSRKKVFHLAGCPYERRIRYANREEVSRNEAVHMGYRACSYCRTMRAYHHIQEWYLDGVKRKNGVEFMLVTDTDTLYMRTDVGFWKIFGSGEMKYSLYHLNRFDSSLPTERMIRGTFHRQNDVKPSSSPNQLIRYILKHDEAMKIIADDYRKLPQHTRKEKKYYEIAKRRDRRQKGRRVNRLLDSLSRGETPASKWVSIC